MTVTAIIPIYQPDVKLISRALYLVTPQVEEVIISCEGKSIVPPEMLKHNKIRTVKTEQKGIGHSRNSNFGAKHATTEWLLIMNDDVHLNEDAVAKMLEVVKPDTGIVVHLLRYPDKRIFATVCERRPREWDFHHVNQLELVSSLKEVIEVENACGASWLIRREVFEKVGGYDEEFFGYCNDNDLCMRVRQEGWKILYTPHARGWHIGHQSFKKLGDPNELCKPGIARFKQKWGPYFTWNWERVPGNFDYLKQ